MKKLLSGYHLKNIELKNRIIMAPMTRCRAIGGIPNDLMAEYYSQRASAGLIITEGTSPMPEGMGYARIPGIYSEQQKDGWKKVVKAVHKKGGKIFVQLMHTGRIGHLENLPDRNRQLMAPSRITAGGTIWTDSQNMQPHSEPNEMKESDILNAINGFRIAAQNAIDVGFDGVEIHGANGYLIDQFINPKTNIRTDRWGGSIENRTRFVIEVLSAVTTQIGKEKVGLRLSPRSTFNDLEDSSEADLTHLEVIQRVNLLNISYLHLIRNRQNSEILTSARSQYEGTLILAGGFTRDSATEYLDENRCDLVAFGSPFISNPDLVDRMKEGHPFTSPNPDTFYTSDALGYTHF